MRVQLRSDRTCGENRFFITKSETIIETNLQDYTIKLINLQDPIIRKSSLEQGISSPKLAKNHGL